MLDCVHMPHVGEHILHYQLLEKIGKGAVGQVFRAFDEKLRCDVALKFLFHPSEQARKRLRIEARAIASLDHANIGRIYALEQQGENFFIAMPFYRGQDVAQLIAAKELSVAKTLDIIKQVLRGLRHAHQRGVIHRDMKPANIFLTEDNVVKILDFGLAHLPDSSVTHQDQLMGTPNYISPEQLKGEVVDARSDIWSLGIVLFHMLTGKLPFKEGVPQVLVAILQDAPTLLRVYHEHPQLERIITRCLAKDRVERFADCDALLEAIDAVEDIGSTTLSDDELAVRRLQLPQHSLIGREREIEELIGILQPDTGIFVSIVGMGGAGKTSLAHAIMSDQRIPSIYPDGAFFIALENVQDVLQLPQIIAQKVGTKLSTHDAWFSLQQFFSNKKALLVMDNLEQFIAECRSELLLLLNKCPRLDILATARQALQLEPEVIYPLRGLAVPEHVEADFSAYGATALFIRKAASLKQSFAVSEAKGDILDICQQLEGWPLGIELAVAWIQKLSAAEIARKLQESATFLSEQLEQSGTSTYQSARAAFEYAWRMLNSNEQDALTKLAVFKAGFTAEAALQVTDTPFGRLAVLLDKRLITLQEDGRYHSHRLIEEFCQEKLQERQDVQQIFQQFVDYYFHAAQSNALKLRGEQQIEGQEYFTLEQDNFQAVLAWLEQQQPEQGLQLALILSNYWFINNDNQLGQQWLRSFRHKLTDSRHLRLRAQGLHNEGVFAWRYYQYDEAEVLLRESLRLYELLADAQGIASLFATLGNLNRIKRHYREAAHFLEQSLELFQQQDNDNGSATALGQLGLLAYQQGNIPRALRLLQDSLALRQKLGDKIPLASAQSALAIVLSQRGDYARAEQHLQQSISLCESLKEQRSLIANYAHLGWLHLLQNAMPAMKKAYSSSLIILKTLNSKLTTAFIFAELAKVMVKLEQAPAAVNFFAFSELLRGSEEVLIGARAVSDIPQTIAYLQNHLDSASFKRFWNEGQQLTVEAAIEQALAILSSA